MKRLALLLAFALLAVSSSAYAQQVSPTEGIPTPDPSLTTQSDSTSLEVNPAGLGYLQGVEAAYGFFLPTQDFRGVIPSGHSLTLGAGTELTGFGAGVQWMNNPDLGAERSNFQKFTLGSALSPSRFLSVGANLHLFNSRTDQRLNELRTADAGIQWRPTRGFGVGLLARDFAPAFLDDDEALPLRLGLGMAFRAADGRLVVEPEIHHVTGTGDFELKPRVAAEPIGGLRIFGQGNVDVAPDDTDSTVAFDGLTLGMELSAGTLGAQGAAHVGGYEDADATTATGTSYRLWAGTPQKRPLVTPTRRWVRLQIDDSIAEQAASRFFGPPTRSFLNLINDIDAIAEDPGVDGVVLDVGALNLGHAQIWEFHRAIERLHDAGKESVAIIDAETPTTRVVYAASAADEVWMQPASP